MSSGTEQAMKPRHFLQVTDLSRREFEAVFSLAEELKKSLKAGQQRLLLKDKTLVMIFEKPSLRTRLSFEIGMTQLGGHAVFLGPADIKMGQRETAGDIGKVTGSMADLVMARTFKHHTLEELASASSVPVINGLSDLEHPCQALADFLTIKEILGRVDDLVVAFVGDGNNNVTHSLVLLSAILGNEFRCGSPQGYWMKRAIVNKAHKIAYATKATLVETDDPAKAVREADVVVTDTWISMGDEVEAKKRLNIFPAYQVNRALVKRAKPGAIFMHCLPAYRGREVTAEVIDGPSSVVYQEAENRLHAQKALMVHLWQDSIQ